MEENHVRIPLNGRIYTNNADELSELIHAELERAGEGAEPVFDAEELEYISSAGLRVLMGLRKGCNKPLIVENVSLEIYDLLETTGIVSLFDVRRKIREVSVEGCDVIGKGFFGTVYRLDDDTVVKVYDSPDAVSMIKNEQSLARAALMKGIPTAISYGIVKAGDRYGSVFEMLRATTCSEWLKNSPEDRDTIAECYADLLRNVNKTVMDEGTLPSARGQFIHYLETVKETLPRDKYERFRDLLDAVPESRNAVHGDCHLSNIMRMEGELMLIDMDTLAVGNAVFELARIFFDYIPFEEDEPGNTLKTYGIPYDDARYVWEKVTRIYFRDKNEDEFPDIMNRIMLAGYLFFLYRMETDFKGRPLSDIRSAHARDHIIRLLDIVNKLAV